MITEAEQKYIALCEQVNDLALRVNAAAFRGKTDRACELALSLSDFVCNEKQAILMRAERAEPDAYSLAALKVDTATASNSETIWERED